MMEADNEKYCARQLAGFTGGPPMKIIFAPIILLLWAMTASATDFSGLSIGQKVGDSKINIGQFNFTLPNGEWTVVAKLEARAGSQSGNSASPTQLSVAVARVEADKVLALFILRTPASTFMIRSRWADDPCGSITAFLVKDTMKQTFNMPECFAIVPVDASLFTSATSGMGEQIAKWLQATQSKLSPKLLRVFYAKYHGGDFLHANMYFPVDSLSVPAAEAWGRGVAAAMQKVVTRDSQEAVFPALP
jgi:hypothetical protein